MSSFFPGRRGLWCDCCGSAVGLDGCSPRCSHARCGPSKRRAASHADPSRARHGAPGSRSAFPPRAARRSHGQPAGQTRRRAPRPRPGHPCRREPQRPVAAPPRRRRSTGLLGAPALPCLLPVGGQLRRHPCRPGRESRAVATARPRSSPPVPGPRRRRTHPRGIPRDRARSPTSGSPAATAASRRAGIGTRRAGIRARSRPRPGSRIAPSPRVFLRKWRACRRAPRACSWSRSGQKRRRRVSRRRNAWGGRAARCASRAKRFACIGMAWCIAIAVAEQFQATQGAQLEHSTTPLGREDRVSRRK